jgi:cobalt-zinc-cadmium efflux system membrane fusion protein
MRLPVSTIVLAASSLLFQGCTSKGESPKSAAEPPAKVENRVKESDLTRITLTPEAAKRLGIETAQAVESEFAPQTTIAGEVVPIPGKALIVSSPVAGKLTLIRSSLAAGEFLRKGEPVFRLTPLASVQRDLRVTLEADLKAAKARLETATQQLARAKQLLRDLAGSQRNVEAAEQEFNQATALHDAALQRLQQIETRQLEADVSMTVVAPDSGIVRQVQAVAGQTVGSGAPLFEVVDFSRVWLRVPVYAGDLDSLPRNVQARVQDIDGTGPVRTATRVAAPPTADPLAVTADIYFELANSDSQLRPGQRLRVILPGSSRVLKGVTVPVAAILYDVQGGSWVYVAEDKYVFRRQRVELLQTHGTTAVLGRGLKLGTNVVTAGAAELFGTEFGAGK